MAKLEISQLSIEEYEAMRLYDVDGLDHRAVEFLAVEHDLDLGRFPWREAVLGQGGHGAAAIGLHIKDAEQPSAIVGYRHDGGSGLLLFHLPEIERPGLDGDDLGGRRPRLKRQGSQNEEETSAHLSHGKPAWG